MKKFRQKLYTIEEGKYTGPKDIEKLPGYLEMIGKTGTAVAGVNAAIEVGKTMYERSKGLSGRPEHDSLLGAAWEGSGKGMTLGIGSGILAKVLLNAMHNPMSSVKYNEVDKNLRQRFGIFHLSGFTIGDSKDRRNKMDEKFSFNDRDITSYKINIAIQNDRVTMYTLGLENEELKNLNKILDYYCKKYQGMDYRSGVLGASSKENSYYVKIIFTNYQIICDFLGEVSDTLMTKINLLDSKAIVESKISGEKTFSENSTPILNKTEVMGILGQTGTKIVLPAVFGRLDLKTIGGALIGGIIKGLNKLSSTEEAIISKGKVKKADLGNRYLETALKELGYIETINYTVGKETSPLNMYLNQGDLIVCMTKDGVEQKKFEKVFDSSNFFSKKDLGKVLVCTYPMKSKDELKVLLRKLIGTGLVPNIYLV